MKKAKLGDRVQVILATTRKASPDPENMWEVVEVGPNGNLFIRNSYDQARAKLRGKNILPMAWHEDMLVKAK